MKPVITISREFGSGGHTVGKEVAFKLGIPFYDGEIVEQVAQQSGLNKEAVKQIGEYTSHWDAYISKNPYSHYATMPQDEVFKLQCNVIREAAAQGPCVIVGRCADYVLAKENIDTINVFIHADTEHRAERVLNRYGETDDKIEKRLEENDKGRKRYYKKYTDRKWGDYKNYQIDLDSGALGIDACVDIIVAAYQAKGE